MLIRIIKFISDECEDVKYIAIVSSFMQRKNINIYIELRLDNETTSLELKSIIKCRCNIEEFLYFMNTVLG